MNLLGGLRSLGFGGRWWFEITLLVLGEFKSIWHPIQIQAQIHWSAEMKTAFALLIFVILPIVMILSIYSQRKNIERAERNDPWKSGSLFEYLSRLYQKQGKSLARLFAILILLWIATIALHLFNVFS